MSNLNIFITKKILLDRYVILFTTHFSGKAIVLAHTTLKRAIKSQILLVYVTVLKNPQNLNAFAFIDCLINWAYCSYSRTAAPPVSLAASSSRSGCRSRAQLSG